MRIPFRLRYIGNRIYWPIVNPFRWGWWYLTRPQGRAAKCLLEHEGKFLLVRTNYGHRSWTVPGGAANRGEETEQAARREVWEEVGVRAGELQKIGTYTRPYRFRLDEVSVYWGVLQDASFRVDGIEIAEAGWFALDALPSPRMPTVEEILRMRENARVTGEVPCPSPQARL